MAEPEDPEDLPPRRAIVHEQSPSEFEENGIDVEVDESMAGKHIYQKHLFDDVLKGWEDGEGDPCPACGKVYSHGDFWIACDFCDVWYCGGCAGVRF